VALKIDPDCSRGQIAVDFLLGAESRIPCFREFISEFFIFDDRFLQILPKIGEIVDFLREPSRDSWELHI
jgi:hypothetical protein